MLDDDEVILICNEEAKLDDLPYNRDIGYDIISGTFIIAGDDYENGDFKSLTEEIKTSKYIKSPRSTVIIVFYKISILHLHILQSYIRWITNNII